MVLGGVGSCFCLKRKKKAQFLRKKKGPYDAKA